MVFALEIEVQRLPAHSAVGIENDTVCAVDMFHRLIMYGVCNAHGDNVSFHGFNIGHPVDNARPYDISRCRVAFVVYMSTVEIDESGEVARMRYDHGR